MTEKPVMLITGSRKGLGLHLTEHYLKKGFRVIGCSRGPAEIKSADYQHFCLDIADEPAVKKMFSAIRKDYGNLDVLINNAGVASMNSVLLTPLTKLRELVDTNLIGTFLFCREAAKLMTKRNSGRIINFTTIAVPLRLEGEAAYGASKAGVECLTRILAKELADFGITVNVIGPAALDTDLTRSLPKKKLESVVARQTIKRLGRLEEVANVTDFFIRPESEFVTGQTIFLGGL
ncbi:MAG: SDR family oxidoreductase [Acidobacteriota bacterium]|nr:SDR family oxidoreductase [Acidobacteriota bacterium]